MTDLKEGTPPLGKCCANCKYWYKMDSRKLDGDCRRNPPVPFPMEITNSSGQSALELHSYFPRTRPEIYCGEFDSKIKIV